MNNCRTQIENGHQVLYVSGEVDLSWSQQAVEYIDSSGIAALVEGFQFARGKKQVFTLLKISKPVLSVLKLARLDRVFVLVDEISAV